MLRPDIPSCLIMPMAVIAYVFRRLITPLITLKIQVGGSQVSKYQEGGMPFGVGDGFALTAVCVSVKLQGILKLDGW